MAFFSQFFCVLAKKMTSNSATDPIIISDDEGDQEVFIVSDDDETQPPTSLDYETQSSDDKTQPPARFCGFDFVLKISGIKLMVGDNLLTIKKRIFKFTRVGNRG